MARNPLRIVLLAVTALFMIGCAQTPQTVRLAPEPPDGYAVDYGKGRTVALRVVDQRLDKTRIGELRNRETEAAPVRTKQELAYVMELTAGETLKAYGFRPVAWDADADRRLTVNITHLSHTVAAAVPRDVETTVRMSATAVHRNSTLKLKAEQREDDRITHRPSAGENARYIESALTGALERIMGDELARFLASGETRG
ncbi:hypothetical protein H0Z60_18215 [Ectothiorhodospiraceae bacterium WFHF3C12]|nr:hypothetical protein [Ectothiorhodospiraceae bacterium WFHF3C12]